MNQTKTLRQTAEVVFRAINSRDFTEFEQMVTDDVSFDFPGAGIVEGSRRTLLLLKSILRKYPELIFTISEIIAQENRAVVIWTNKGKDHQGNPYANSGVTLLHFSQGKISFISDYFKDTSFVG
jgi:ketosteroid isomerase-like protein